MVKIEATKPIDLTWLDLTWHDLTWHDLTWLDLTWHDLTWLDLTWHDLTWHDLTWLDLTPDNDTQIWLQRLGNFLPYYLYYLPYIYACTLAPWQRLRGGCRTSHCGKYRSALNVTTYEYTTKCHWKWYQSGAPHGYSWIHCHIFCLPQNVLICGANSIRATFSQLWNTLFFW